MAQNPGIIFYTDALTAPDLEAFAKRLEELDYDVLLVPEFFGREPFSTVSYILARTERLKVATGIANVYARDAIVTAQARQTLAELSDGRFVLGLGVSHPPMAEAHGLEWIPPLRKMREYLDVIDQMKIQSPEPAKPAPIWIAAHGPNLLELAASRVDAANTYLMPPRHTADARKRVGAEFRLNVVVPSVLSEDPIVARKIGRKALSIYMPLPAYQTQWLAWGFEASDFADGGSDRLVDALIAWGDEAAIRARMDEHRAAGASQIILSALNHQGRGPAWPLIEAMGSSG
jgi:probable F420-dependent oxidoreductase